MKRFTETAKWSDPWFRALKPEMKLLWQWLLDTCDSAGVIDADIPLASFQIGFEYPMDVLLGFAGRVDKMPCGKWFVTKFIPFQYGNLSKECKAHRPVFQSLDKHFPKGYPKGINTLKEKEKETEEEKETSSLSSTAREPEEPNGNQMVCVVAPCTIEQARAQAQMHGMTPAEADYWWHTRNTSGWTRGGSGGSRSKITAWQSDLATSTEWAKEGAAKAKGKHKGIDEDIPLI